MNRRCYRLVFNKAKGRRVVVSEADTSERQDGPTSPCCGLFIRPVTRYDVLGTVKPLIWSILLALGVVSVPVHAQIFPDRSAPGSQRPHVLKSANGTPQVNITTPNAKGVSRNAYRQFDVDGKGVIINNARSVTPTRIGGWVQGNPNLATGEARVIISEINSSNPSRLHGAVEIAGSRAEVVIANPAGIDVDGAGFINAQGVTLTTGQPQFKNGALDGYRVEGGTVKIHGAGLDAGDADYAAILARAAELQAGVWAEELEVVAGANRISTDRRTAEAIDGSGEAPDVAIDVAHLGGMYAGKIRLVANEHGVGVNNAGQVAASRQLAVTTNGRLENRGELISEGELRLAGQDGVKNRGTIRAGDGIEVTSRESIANRAGGAIIAGGDLRLDAMGRLGTISNTQDATLAGGVHDDGSLGTRGDLRLTATQGINVNGQNLAAGGVYAVADTVSLRDSRTRARDIDITAHDGDIDASGADVAAKASLSANSTATLRTDDGRVQAEHFDIAAAELSNRGGDLTQHGDDALTLDVERLDNTEGLIASNADLAAHADNLGNEAGKITAGGSLNVNVDGDIDNTSGMLQAADDISLDAGGDLRSSGTLYAAGDLRLRVNGELINDGSLAAQGATDVDTTTLRSGVDSLLAAGLIADGTLGRAGDLTVTTTGQLSLHGRFRAAGTAAFSGAALDLTGSYGHATELDMQALDGDLITRDAQLATSGILRLYARREDTQHWMNERGTLTTHQLDIDVANLDNTQGEILQTGEGASGIELSAATGMLDNTWGRIATNGDDLNLKAATLINTGGRIEHTGQGDLQLTATTLAGKDGKLVSRGDFTLHGGELVLDGARTQAQRIALQADRLSHLNGELLHLGDQAPLTVNVAQVLDNTAGLIASNTALDLRAGDLINQDGTLQAAGDAYMKATSLDNRQGEVLAGGSLTLETDGDINNTQGRLVAEGDLDVSAPHLTNQDGLLGAVQGGLGVTAASLDNTQGRLEAADGLNLDIANTLTNDTGEIVQADDGELHLATGSLAGSDGLILSRGDLTLHGGELVLDGARTQAQRITLHADRLSHQNGELMQLGDQAPLTLDIAQELDNTSGLIASNSGLELQAGTLINQSGTLQAVDDSYVQATSLNNQQGKVLADGLLTLEVDGAIDNTQGQLLAQRSVDLQAATLRNDGGTIGAVEEDLTLAIAGAIDNHTGSLDAGGQLTVTGQGLDNQDGSLSGEQMTLDTGGQRLNNTDGLIAARDTLDVTSGGLDNIRGTLQAGGDMTVDTQGQTLTNVDSGATGGMLANGTLRLTSGDLDNTNGLIGGGTLNVTANAVTNGGGGTLLSESALTLAADSLDNRSGELQALGDMTLGLDQALRNQGGLVRAGESLDITASRLVNSATQGGDQGVEGRRVSISAEEVVNRQGAIRANQRLEIDAASRVNNHDGLISSLQTLTLNTGELDNQGGTLIANQQFDLTTVGLTGDGRVLSLGDLALQLASDFTLGQGSELLAEDDLRLTTTGTLNNRGTLQAGDTLDLTASEIVNTASGELSGTTTRLSAKQLTNRGLIDGITTRLDATTLDNLGSGRIYGDQLGIQADTLTNDVENGQAAVIAARERLDIGARHLTNREDALIFSAGDMAIGGHLDADDRATGRATRLDNNSATIEALGDLSLSAVKLNNTNEHIETEMVATGGAQKGIYIHPLDSVPNSIEWDERIPMSEFYIENGQFLHRESGQRILYWYRYDIERVEYESRVTHSKPGQILSEGELNLKGEYLVNDNSHILAGGFLTGDLGNVNNLGVEAEQVIKEKGNSQYGYVSCFWVENGCAGPEYTYELPKPHETEKKVGESGELSITEFAGNRNFGGSGAHIAQRKSITLGDSAQGTVSAQVDLQNQGASGSIIEVPALVSSGSAVDVRTRQADLTLADTSILDRQAVASARTSNGETLDGIVPSTSNDNLGNIAASLPESNEVIRTLMLSVRLPSNSLFRMHPEPTATYLVETDPRFTDRRQWLNSDYLLNNLSPDPAVTDKRLGDGFYEQRLIREQVTQLTGQRFLEGYDDAQEQYAALMNNAATFAKAHDLRPGVALTAEQMAQLTSDIVWLVEQTVTLDDGGTVKVLVPQVYARLREGDLKGDGTLIAGDSLQLDIAGDVVNSGTLAGRELVRMTADNLTNLEGRISSNRIDLEARRDLANLGGEVTADESLKLQAGRDLNLASTPERLAGLYVTGHDGQLLASAGRDLTLSGADTDSRGRLQLTAGRDLDIASTLSLEQQHRGQYTVNRTELDRVETLTAGNELVLGAGRDLTLTAANISTEESALLSAGRNLRLDILEERYDKPYQGNTTRERQEVSTRLDITGDLSLTAGQDLYARAAEVGSQGDLTALAGRDLLLDAGQSSEYAESRSWSTHTIDSQRRVMGSEFSASGDLLLQAGNDLRLTASRLQAGDNTSLLAGGDVEFLTAQEQDYSFYEKKSSGGLFGGSRTQRDEVSKTRSIGSEVNSGSDLLVTSGLDQTYQAARLDAVGDIALRSGGSIRFETASDMHTESHERSKSSFAWQSASGEGFTRETLRQSELVAQGELIIQAADGLQIDVEEIDRRSVTRTIDAMVAASPDLAWLKEMDERGDIDWRQVKAIHDSWDYEQSGLGGGAAMVVAIAAAATGQYYALAAMGGAGAGTMAVAASAAAGSLAGTGAVSLINNRGNLGDTFSDTLSSDSLRGAAIAAISAGATQGVMGDTTHPTSGATTRLDLSKTGDIARFAGQRATQAAIDAGARTAIDGGSLSDNLEDGFENALAHVASGVLFNAVGTVSEGRFTNGSPEKIALHALTGGMVTEAMGGDFRTGAMAAGANEALVDHLAELVNDNPGLLVAASQVVGVIAAEMTKGDISQGADIAAQGTRYNYLRHDQVDDYIEELEGCEARGDCTEIQEKYRALSIAQQDELIALCATDSVACAAEYQHLVDDSERFREALDGFGGSEVPWQIGLDAGPLLGQYMEAESVVSQEGFAQYLQEQHGLDSEQASVLSAMAAGTIGANSRVRPVNGRMPINSKYANATVPLEDLPSEIRKKYPHSVPFSGAGFPDFSRYSVKNVRIELGRSREVDFRRADRAAGYNLENPRPEGYTWHHHQEPGFMQLVPTDLHDAIKHTGGIAASK